MPMDSRCHPTCTKSSTQRHRQYRPEYLPSPMAASAVATSPLAPHVQRCHVHPRMIRNHQAEYCPRGREPLRPMAPRRPADGAGYRGLVRRHFCKRGRPRLNCSQRLRKFPPLAKRFNSGTIQQCRDSSGTVLDQVSSPGLHLSKTGSHTLRLNSPVIFRHAMCEVRCTCTQSAGHQRTDAARKTLSTSNIKTVWASPAAHSQLSHTTTLSQYCIVCDCVCPTATRATRFGKLRSLTPSPCPRPSAGWRTYLAARRSPRRLG